MIIKKLGRLSACVCIAVCACGVDVLALNTYIYMLEDIYGRRHLMLVSTKSIRQHGVCTRRECLGPEPHPPPANAHSPRDAHTTSRGGATSGFRPRRDPRLGTRGAPRDKCAWWWPKLTLSHPRNPNIDPAPPAPPCAFHAPHSKKGCRCGLVPIGDMNLTRWANVN